MLLFLKKWCPVVMVIFTALGMLVYYNDTSMFGAYTTGFTGWLVVTMHEFIPETRKHEG